MDIEYAERHTDLDDEERILNARWSQYPKRRRQINTKMEIEPLKTCSTFFITQNMTTRLDKTYLF